MSAGGQWGDLTIAELRIFLSQHRGVSCPSALYRLKSDYVQLCESTFNQNDLKEALDLFGKGDSPRGEGEGGDESEEERVPQPQRQLPRQRQSHPLRMAEQSLNAGPPGGGRRQREPGVAASAAPYSRRSSSSSSESDSPMAKTVGQSASGQVLRTAGRFSLPSEDIYESPSLRRGRGSGRGASSRNVTPGFSPFRNLGSSPPGSRAAGPRPAAAPRAPPPEAPIIEIKEESSEEEGQHSPPPVARLPLIAPDGNPIEWRIRTEPAKPRARFSEASRAARGSPTCSDGGGDSESGFSPISSGRRDGRSSRREYSEGGEFSPQRRSGRPSRGEELSGRDSRRGGELRSRRGRRDDAEGEGAFRSGRSRGRSRSARRERSGRGEGGGARSPPPRVRVRWARVAAAALFLILAASYFYSFYVHPLLSRVLEVTSSSLAPALEERYCDFPEGGGVLAGSAAGGGGGGDGAAGGFSADSAPCSPCPEHALCRGGSASCNFPAYIPRKERVFDAAIGRYKLVTMCVRNTAAARAASVLAARAGLFLAEVRGDAECNLRPLDPRNPRYGVAVREPGTGRLVRGCLWSQVEAFLRSAGGGADVPALALLREQLGAAGTEGGAVPQTLRMFAPDGELRRWESEWAADAVGGGAGGAGGVAGAGGASGGAADAESPFPLPSALAARSASGVPATLEVFYASTAVLPFLCRFQSQVRKWVLPATAAALLLHTIFRRIRRSLRDRALIRAVARVIAENTQIMPLASRQSAGPGGRGYAVGPRAADVYTMMTGAPSAAAAGADRQVSRGVLRTVLCWFFRLFVYVFVPRRWQAFCLRRSRRQLRRGRSFEGGTGAAGDGTLLVGLRRSYPEYAALAASESEVSAACDRLCQLRPQEFCKNLFSTDMTPFYFSLDAVGEIQRKYLGAGGEATAAGRSHRLASRLTTADDDDGL